MRSCGILLPITSLPSNYGIGTLGKEAYNFVDFLAKSAHANWQILPIGPTTIGDSPYQSFSVFAGNPLLIDLDFLIEQGLLSQKDVDSIDFGSDPTSVDYGLQFLVRYDLLKLAYQNSKKQPDAGFETFKIENTKWLNNYALFMTLKYAFEQRSWNEWPDPFKFREQVALEQYTKQYEQEIEYWKFIQYLFYSQWNALKEYAVQKGIQIVGDIPIYVSYDSVDVWVHPELFLLDASLLPIKVAGCPPDDTFSKTGQLWGNPVYNWDVLKQTNFTWWIERIRHSLTTYDVLRIDHFRGFESFYAIPYEHKTAEFGEWLPCPGKELFAEIKRQLGSLNIIAEDLGFITKEVRELLDYTGFPGMKVLQFAFYGSNENSDMPHNFIKNCVAYTGTHDNDTCLGYLKNLDTETLSFLKKYVHAESLEETVDAMIRQLYASVADMVVVQMQDFLGLNSKARMNYPSTPSGNWKWRMRKEDLTDALSEKMRALSNIYFRNAVHKQK